MMRGPPYGPVCRFAGLADQPADGSEAFLPKRTYQPKKRRRARRHGFMHRNRTRNGKAILKRRTLKGRWRLAV
jgi:large subunit ribosomal protein L34